MKYTTVIFDLDGTLLNTINDLADSVNYMLKLNGFPVRSLSEITSFVGNGVYRLIERSLPQKLPDDEFAACVSQFRAHYSVHSADKTVPYDGITDLLRNLKANGIKTAVVSNKMDEQTRSLCNMFFGSLIDYSVGQKDNIRKKPYPDSVLDAVKILGSDIGSTVYIGDSEVDFETASNSGVDFIGVSWGYRGRDFLEKLGAEEIADSAQDLTDMLKGKKL